MVLVRKMDGTLEEWNREKLKKSLMNSGASAEAAEEITSHIEGELYEKITTQEIYSHAFEILKHYGQRPVAARYSLKRAIFDLGPSGFPFERFIGILFEELGYKNVKTGFYKAGACAPHELDLYAEKDGVVMGAEVKFHNTPGFKTDLKVALYVQARFEDLKNAKHSIDEGWLITNTRFTHNVIKYSKCAGLNLLSWDYPKERSLLRLIEDSKIHPITAVTSLKSKQKKDLLNKGIVTCKQALRILNENIPLPVSGNFDEKELLQELKALCG